MRIVVILVGLLLCRTAAGQALEERPAGAAGLALAGGGVSSLRSPAALWINPALLPIAGSNIALELGLLSDSRQVTITELVNQPAGARDMDGVHLSPAIALVHRLGLRWLWGGVAYRVARQMHSRFPQQTFEAQRPSRTEPGRYLGGALTLEQHVVALALGLGVRRAALGASLELSHIRFSHRRALWAGTAADAGFLEDARSDLTAEIQAQRSLSPGAVLGAWARPVDWLDLGAAVRLPVEAALEGEVTLTPSPGRPTGKLESAAGTARIDLKLPLEVRGGVALGPRRWRLLLEAGYQRWSAADQPIAKLTDVSLVLSPSAGPRIEQALEELPLGIGLRDSVALRAGVELAPWGKLLVVRTGYAYHRGASVARQPSPVLLDLDRHVWGLGVESSLSWLHLGVSFAHSFESTLTVTESPTELFNPIDPAVVAPIGAGLYRSSRVQVIFEAGIGW